MAEINRKRSAVDIITENPAKETKSHAAEEKKREECSVIDYFYVRSGGDLKTRWRRALDRYRHLKKIMAKFGCTVHMNTIMCPEPCDDYYLEVKITHTASGTSMSFDVVDDNQKYGVRLDCYEIHLYCCPPKLLPAFSAILSLDYQERIFRDFLYEVDVLPDWLRFFHIDEKDESLSFVCMIDKYIDRPVDEFERDVREYAKTPFGYDDAKDYIDKLFARRSIEHALDSLEYDFEEEEEEDEDNDEDGEEEEEGEADENNEDQ